MKLPSLHSLLSKTGDTFRRFPVVLLFAATATAFSIVMIHLENDDMDKHHWYWNVIQSAYLGMLLLLALAVYSERKGLSARARIGLQAAGIVLTVLYDLHLPHHFRDISMLRGFLYALGLHWLIAFIPFTARGEINGFWQYNKILFLRILTALLYSTVLYMGLSLALLAIDKLFKADIDYRWYIYLWCFLAGLFNTWFFLAGFPREYASLEERTDYPKGLKIFTQYVLLPIITIYLLILYAYMGKIVFTAQWPVGWVSNLILGFSVAGILSLLLIHPVRNEAHNKWILVFSKFFYFALFPLLILLFFAIERRIRDYGITESRYFVLLLALWLAFVGLYFLLSATKSIKLIPLSLCVLAFLSSFGPWGAFGVSVTSQKARLTRLLEKNDMLAAGKIVRPKKSVPFADRKMICSVVRYLTGTHGYDVLQPYFSQNLDSLLKRENPGTDRFGYEQSEAIAGLMNIEYVQSYQTEAAGSENDFYTTANSDKRGADIEGYQYLIEDYNVYLTDRQKNCSSYPIGKVAVEICFDPLSDQLIITGYGDTALKVPVDPIIRSLRANSKLNTDSQEPDSLSAVADNGKFRCKLMLAHIRGTADGNKITLTELSGMILLGKSELK